MSILQTSRSRLAVALVGALVFSVAGGAIGSMNAGWFDLERNSNGMLPWMGVGAGLVVVSFLSSRFSAVVAQAGGVGRAAKVLLTIGPSAYVLSWFIEFAIIGTLTLFAGLVCLTVSVSRTKLVSVLDRILVGISAAGSIAWNTETTSAFLLVGVGIIWMILSVRLHLTLAPASVAQPQPVPL